MTGIHSSTPLFIDGRSCDATGGETFATLNPATGQLLSHVQKASAADVERALASASRGFEVWSAMTGTERGRVLHRASQLLRERNDELAAMEVADTGKPIAEASVVDVASGADCLEYFAGVAPTLSGEHLDFGSAFAYTRREPLGVCVGIGAWNYPLQIACWKAAPALACGNAMVFKPSEQTPLTAVALAEVFTEAGLPPGVFNVVHGRSEVGRWLVQHDAVAKVSLTGSVPTGARVMADAAAGLKHVTLELGGKSPILVFDDADVRNAVSGALLGNFYTQGEICSNGTRVYVHEAIKARFVEELLARTAKLQLGDPTDPATDVGSLISRAHLEKVAGYVDRAKAAGARVLCGGRQVTEGALAEGAFYAPTVLDVDGEDLEIVREEVFGPVMSLLTFTDEDDVIRRANDTPFGLAAGVFTQNLARAHRVVARLQAGTCWINTFNITPIEVPFGGVKRSGLGRENGRAAIEHYTQLKSVYVELGDVDSPY